MADLEAVWMSDRGPFPKLKTWFECVEERDAEIKHLDGQIRTLLRERREIEAALDRRKLFLFKHIDGTFSINDK